MLRYTVLRVLVFFGAVCALWLVGLRSAEQRVLLLAAAAVLSLPISYVALRSFREDYSAQIAERLAAREAGRQHKRTDEDDEDDEDAALDAGEPGAAGLSAPHRHDDDFR